MTMIRRSNVSPEALDWTRVQHVDGKSAWISQTPDGQWCVHLPTLTLTSREEAERAAERLLAGVAP